MSHFAVVLMAFVALLTVSQGQDLQLSATPSNVVNGTTEQLDITCETPAMENGATLMILLQVVQMGPDDEMTLLASQQATGTVLHRDNDNKTSAEGELTGTGGKLTVSIASPGVSDTGKYGCKFGYFNMREFRFTAVNKTVEVTFTEPDEPTPPPMIPDSCSCDQVWEEVKNLRETVLAENTALRDQLRSYDDACRVSFTARLSDRAGNIFSSNMPVIFNSVITNKGGAYNTTTGVFKAPCAGQYFFRVSMRTRQERDSGFVDAAIEVNGEEMARSSVFTADLMDHYEQASNGLVVTLAENDEVLVRIQTNSAGSMFGQVFSVFSGFFLSP